MAIATQPFVIAFIGAAVLSIGARQFAKWRFDKLYQFAVPVLAGYALYAYLAGERIPLLVGMALVTIGILGIPPISRVLFGRWAPVSQSLAMTLLFFGAVYLAFFTSFKVT